MSNLKPCPFCGGEATFEETEIFSARGVRWTVGCRDENCIGQQSLATFNRRSEAADAWNRRAADQPSSASEEGEK